MPVGEGGKIANILLAVRDEPNYPMGPVSHTSRLTLRYRLSKKEAKKSKVDFKHQQYPTQAQVKFLPDYTGDDKKIRRSFIP
jgi:hypothetical protein